MSTLTDALLFGTYSIGDAPLPNGFVVLRGVFHLGDCTGLADTHCACGGGLSLPPILQEKFRVNCQLLFSTFTVAQTPNRRAFIATRERLRSTSPH